MTKTIQLVIADDKDIAREGMRRILAAEEDIEVVGEGATVHETIEKVHELHPDVLLLDLEWFKDKSAGIDAIKRLTSEVPETKIIAITVYEDDLIEPARKAGAVAALTKGVSKQRLIDEIRSIYRLPPPPPSPQVGSSPTTPVEELTEREQEVLTLLAEGKTDKEIATALSIAESTAKNHVSHILGKLSVPNRARAVAVGYELGLVGANDE